LHNTIELRTAASEIAAPKPAGAIAGKKILKRFLKRILKRNQQRQKGEKVVPTHHRTLDAATPIGFLLFYTLL
jgi:hypothetical protein